MPSASKNSKSLWLGFREKDILVSERCDSVDTRAQNCIIARVKYRVLLIQSPEGFAVTCPALPGCWSHGKTEAEALANIREGIRGRLEAREEIQGKEAPVEGTAVYVREVELAAA